MVGSYNHPIHPLDQSLWLRADNYNISIDMY